jgi:hypothetical protein
MRLEAPDHYGIFWELHQEIRSTLPQWIYLHNKTFQVLYIMYKKTHHIV